MQPQTLCFGVFPPRQCGVTRVAKLLINNFSVIVMNFTQFHHSGVVNANAMESFLYHSLCNHRGWRKQQNVKVSIRHFTLYFFFNLVRLIHQLFLRVTDKKQNFRKIDGCGGMFISFHAIIDGYGFAFYINF